MAKKRELSPEDIEEAGGITEFERVRQMFGVTFKQYSFCRNYIISGNGTKAAEAAGYAGTYKTLNVKGCVLLKQEKVQKCLKWLEQRAKDRAIRIDKNKIRGIDMDYVMERYIDLIENCENPVVKRAALSDVTKILGGFAPTKAEITHVSISSALQEARQRQLEYINQNTVENLTLADVSNEEELEAEIVDDSENEE